MSRVATPSSTARACSPPRRRACSCRRTRTRWTLSPTSRRPSPPPPAWASSDRSVVAAPLDLVDLRAQVGGAAAVAQHVAQPRGLGAALHDGARAVYLVVRTALIAAAQIEG